MKQLSRQLSSQLITGALILFVAHTGLAADAPAVMPAPASTPSSVVTKKAADSQVNVSFDELLIQGQYHFSDEAVVTVEDDKVLDALLGVRKDFKDRIKQSSTR
ncbi:MAG: hypothetical protein AABZ31_07830 [Bdellovibrionota bacterium]